MFDSTPESLDASAMRHLARAAGDADEASWHVPAAASRIGQPASPDDPLSASAAHPLEAALLRSEARRVRDLERLHALKRERRQLELAVDKLQADLGLCQAAMQASRSSHLRLYEQHQNLLQEQRQLHSTVCSMRAELARIAPAAHRYERLRALLPRSFVDWVRGLLARRRERRALALT